MKPGKIKISISLSLLGLLLSVLPAQAICPVCTVAVGAGLGLSRWFGISDLVTGVWAGSLLFSVSMWTVNWLRDKKKISNKWVLPLSFIGYYGLTLIPLYFSGVIGHPYNTFLGIDKLIFGVVVGSIFFMIGSSGYEELKKRNGGKAWFPFQKVAMPVVSVLIASLIMAIIEK
ncbi:MAG: hypothetical protein PHG66_03625 [Candidatus Colwellbacteria bacterium]|nr:hypothetical protein [Candidatus Colwellbacteria bacterium]